MVKHSFADKEGNVVPATYYGMSEAFPLEMLVTVTFEGIEGKTKLTLTHVGLPSGEDRDNCRAGWNESFDKLAEVLAKAQKKEREMDMQEMMAKPLRRKAATTTRSKAHRYGVV